MNFTRLSSSTKTRVLLCIGLLFMNIQLCMGQSTAGTLAVRAYGNANELVTNHRDQLLPTTTNPLLVYIQFYEGNFTEIQNLNRIGAHETSWYDDKLIWEMRTDNLNMLNRRLFYFRHYDAPRCVMKAHAQYVRCEGLAGNPGAKHKFDLSQTASYAYGDWMVFDSVHYGFFEYDPTKPEHLQPGTGGSGSYVRIHVIV